MAQRVIPVRVGHVIGAAIMLYGLFGIPLAGYSVLVDDVSLHIAGMIAVFGVASVFVGRAMWQEAEEYERETGDMNGDS